MRFCMVVALVVFGVSEAVTKENTETQYRWIVYSSITVGCCFVVICLMGTKEPSLRRNLRETSRSGIPWSYWFRKILLPSSCYGFSPHSTNTECFTGDSN